MQSNEKKRVPPESSKQPSVEMSEKTENTKKCDYIDQYFTYKNNQKKELAQALHNQVPPRRNGDSNLVANAQSFGDQHALQTTLAFNQRASSGKRAQDSSTESFAKENQGEFDLSRSERRSKKTDGEE